MGYWFFCFQNSLGFSEWQWRPLLKKKNPGDILFHCAWQAGSASGSIHWFNWVPLISPASFLSPCPSWVQHTSGPLKLPGQESSALSLGLLWRGYETSWQKRTVWQDMAPFLVSFFFNNRFVKKQNKTKQKPCSPTFKHSKSQKEEIHVCSYIWWRTSFI